MPALIKHCPSIYRPAPGRKIRIGTLSQFRTIENAAVRDETEGLYSVELRFDGSFDVNLQWLSDMTFGISPVMMFGGTGSNIWHNLSVTNYYGRSTWGTLHSTERVNVISRTTQSIKFTGSIWLHFEQTDAFVFCMSKSENVGSVILDDQYDASWTVAEDQVSAFAERMNQEIGNFFLSGRGGISTETIGPITMPPWIIPEMQQGDINYMTGVHGSVTYGDKVIVVSSPDDINRSRVEDYLERAATIKPSRFSAEQEHRFLFFPVLRRSGRDLLSPNMLEPIFLDCEPFLEFIT